MRVRPIKFDHKNNSAFLIATCMEPRIDDITLKNIAQDMTNNADIEELVSMDPYQRYNIDKGETATISSREKVINKEYLTYVSSVFSTQSNAKLDVSLPI